MTGKLHPIFAQALAPFAPKPVIVTRFVYPPIPVRTSDWCAFYEGQEETGDYGWGRTEAEAVADLKANYEEPTP